MEALVQGVTQALSMHTLFITLLGVIGGTIVGAIPGLTATMAVAVLLPFTFGLPPMDGLAMLSGIYIGGVYGGSISAVLLRIPGTPSSIMTARDGYPLAQKGEGGRAIGISTISSFIGGLVSIIFLIIAAAPIAAVAVKFSAPEFFAVAIWGLSSVADVSGDDLLHGLIAVTLGVFLGTIGMDPVTGIFRFTLGSQYLVTGLEFVPIMIGLFGLSEVLRQFGPETVETVKSKLTRVLPTLADFKRILPTITRGTLLGLWIGVLPGATGGGMASIVSYNAEVKSSKTPEKFGTGMIEGVAASESANNASIGGNFIPLLTLGIPGDTVTALLIGAFMIHNLRPGPMLYQHNADLVYGLYVALIVAHFFMLVVGLAGAKYFARAVAIPRNILIPLIIILTVTGSYAVNGNIFDVGVMVAFGVLGYVMEGIGLPLAPFILGLILGPMAEANLRTALIMSKGSFLPLLTRPICLFFWALIILQLGLPRLKAWRQRLRAARA